MGYKQLSGEKRAEYIQHRIDQGMSVRDIAKEASVSAMTISRDAKKFGIQVLSRTESAQKKNRGRPLSYQHRLNIARSMFSISIPHVKKKRAQQTWYDLSREEQKKKRKRMSAIRQTRTNGSKLRRMVISTLEEAGYIVLVGAWQNGFKTHLYLPQIDCVIQFNTSDRMLYAFRINREEYLDKIRTESIIWARNGKLVMRVKTKGRPGLYKQDRLANTIKRLIKRGQSEDIFTLDVDAAYAEVVQRERWLDD